MARHGRHLVAVRGQHAAAGRGKRKLGSDEHVNTTNAEIPSPLHRLPAEVRNSIYEVALIDKDVIEFPSRPKKVPDVKPPDFEIADFERQQRNFERQRRDVTYRSALTRTCRAIRSETLSMFYRGNTFLIDGLDDFPWLLAIRAENRARMTNLYARYLADAPAGDIFHDFGDSLNLRVVYVDGLFRRCKLTFDPVEGTG